MLGAAVAIPLIAFGFADYPGYFLPGDDNKLVAASLTILFVILKGFGMTAVTRVQPPTLQGDSLLECIWPFP